MKRPTLPRRSLLAAFCALLLACPALAQSPPEMSGYVDLETGFRIRYPKAWRREVPPSGPAKLVLGEPAGEAVVLCSVEHAKSAGRIGTQARLDRDLARGFRTPAWPQQLAGKRHVLDYQVREIGGVPMGAVEWDGTEERDGRPAHARGIKVFRATPSGLWTVECAAIAPAKEAAEQHFAQKLDLIGDIIGSVQFPR